MTHSIISDEHEFMFDSLGRNPQVILINSQLTATDLVIAILNLPRLSWRRMAVKNGRLELPVN